MSEVAIIQQEQEMAVQYPQNALTVDVWNDKEAFDQTARQAAMLAKSSIVPQNYQGKPEDCFLAICLARRMNAEPWTVMQNLNIVRGRPSWSGQACMSMIRSGGEYRNVELNYTGTKGTDSRGCYVTAERIRDGKIIEGTEVTMAMAKAEGWLSNSKWKTMPEQMLGYRAAAFFARLYCPDIMMGFQTYEEVLDTQQAPRNKAQQLTDALKAETTPKEEPKVNSIVEALRAEVGN